MTKARDLADLGNKTSLDEINDAYDAGALSNRNMIINGAMQVAQRGTSSTSTNYQTVDRWRNGFGGVTLTQSQEDLTSGEPFDQGFRSFLRLTQSGSSSAATDYAQISQRIEGLNAATSGWNYKSSGGHVAYSFWVRSSLAGTYYIYMQTRSSSGDGYINVPFTVAANTWTKVTASIAGNSSLNIDNDNTAGIEFRIVPYYGTNYTGSTLPSNTWYYDTSSGELPDYAQNWCGTSGATFDVTGVQLEVGDTATPFEHRSYGDELAKCHRYFQKLSCSGTSTRHMMGAGHYNTSTSLVIAYQHYGGVMRANPTGTLSALNLFDLEPFDTAPTAISINVITNKGCYIGCTDGTSRTTGFAGSLFFDTAGAFISFDAEL
jgi:hypothetical protein